MNIKPNISVLMCVYNEEPLWLREAIESILNQTYSNFEFIITLDNPLNLELDKIILDYKEKDNRIVYIKNKKNLGLIASLNNELAISKGIYIARMDADDISLLKRLQIQLDFLKANPKVDLVGGNIMTIDEASNILTDNHNNAPSDYKFIKIAMKYKSVFIHPTLMFKRKVAIDDRIEGYRDILYVEDYDFVCRFITNNFMVTNVKECLLKYRVRSTSVSRSNVLYQMKVKSYVIRLYKERLKGVTDSFSKVYIEGLKINEKEIKNFELSNKIAEKAIYYKNKKWFLNYSLLFLVSKLVNKNLFINSIRNTFYKLLYRIYT